MSIELKQAARQALDALVKSKNALEVPWFSHHTTPIDYAIDDIESAITALRTAIQQAESEPVGFVDFQGTVFWHDGPPPADSLLFAAKPVSHDKEKWCEYVAGMVFAWLEMQENLKEEDRCIKAITGIIERRMWALPTTHPAPGVPDGVVKDAERYRWLRSRMCGADFDWNESGIFGLVFELPDDAKVSANCDKTIDAAMAAAQAQKGQQ